MSKHIVEAMIEIPLGSKNKYEIDKTTGRIKLDRVLYASMIYPAEYGVVENTLAPDGDALDILVICSDPTFPGCIVPARVLGYLDMVDNGKLDYKLITVVDCDPRYDDVNELSDLSPFTLKEIANFFSNYKILQGINVEVGTYHSRDEALQIKGVGKSFGERTLFSDIYLRVTGGERIAFIGDNGTGKTTLLNMIMQLEPIDTGMIRTGPAIRTAYLPQIISFDHPERNLVDTMLYAKKNLSAQSARNRLAAYQFQGEDVFKSVSVLSGGELSRLRLCMLMDEEINFLVLDEPTNHLDIASREWIEEAVEAYDGTLLFVSHDRYFINRFATRIWELADGTITDYPMGFAEYKRLKAEEKRNAPPPVKQEKKGDTRQPRMNREKQAIRRQLTICETGISKLEAECARLDALMEGVACDPARLNEVYTQKQETEERLMAEMARWEELSLQLEE